MRTRIKVTDLTEPQWQFINRFVLTEYPLDGTAVRVTYEFSPELEFNTVLPVGKFYEIQGHLACLDKFGYPFHDPDEQDDFTRENAYAQAALERDQATARECLRLINNMIATIDGMRDDMRQWRENPAPATTYPKELLR